MTTNGVQRHANRLANETSPYLLRQLPWGDEAFAKAKAEDKPVFLPIGYSGCHWCHVHHGRQFENVFDFII